MTHSDTIEVACPSGLRGIIRPLVVGDISTLTTNANRRSADPLGTLFRNVWLKTLDVGPYGADSRIREGEGLDLWESVLVADRAFLVFESRRVTYGDDFYFTVPCRNCRAKIEWVVNLSELEVSPLSEEALEGIASTSVKDAVFYRTLPRAGTQVGLRLLTGAHQRIVEKAHAEGPGAMQEAALLCRLAHVDGAASPGDRRKFVRGIGLTDLDFLREEWENLDASVQDTIEIECPSCDGEQEVSIPTDERFFSPRSAHPKRTKR